MMKRILAIIGMALAITTSSVQAQTNSVSVTNTTPSTWEQTLSAFSWSSLASITNWAIEPYMTYAPKLASGDKWGGGVLGLYNLNEYVAGGIGIDYLGRFTMFSGDLTLKLPIHVSQYAKLPAPFDNLTITPFVLGAVGTPLTEADANSGAIMIWDAGAAIQFGHLWGGRFNTGVSYGSWENAGDYTGKRYHFFMGWSKDF